MLLSLLSLLASGDVDRTSIAYMMVMFASLMFVTFVCMPVHESAHAFVANLLGDDTGRLQGRITLNPFAHLDMRGLIMMLIFGFGYARPVPVNINRFKNRKLGFALTAIAGPISNIVVTVIAALLASLFYPKLPQSMAFQMMFTFFTYIAVFNLSLALFNLIPVPPLDGSRLVTLVLPDKYYYKLLQYERYFVWGILAVAFLASRLSFVPSMTEISYEAVVFLETLFINLFV